MIKVVKLLESKYAIEADTIIWTVTRDIPYYPFSTAIKDKSKWENAKICLSSPDSIIFVDFIRNVIAMSEQQLDKFSDKLFTDSFVAYLDELSIKYPNNRVLVDVSPEKDMNVFIYNLSTGEANQAMFIRLLYTMYNAIDIKKSELNVSGSVFVLDNVGLFKYSNFEALYYIGIKQRLNLMIGKDPNNATSESTDLILKLLSQQYGITLDTIFRSDVTLEGTVEEVVLPKEINTEYIDRLSRTKLSKLKNSAASIITKLKEDTNAVNNQPPLIPEVLPTLLLSDIINGRPITITAPKYIVAIDSILPFDITKAYYDKKLNKVIIFQGEKDIDVDKLKDMLGYTRIAIIKNGALVQTTEA